MMKKINAFTLLEVTVTMLLSAICVGICYTAFTLVNQYHNNLQQRKNLVGNVMQISHLLNRDFDRAVFITALDNNLRCLTDSGVITYAFTNTAIIRNQYQLKDDTIKLNIANLIIKYQPKTDEQNQLVNELSFSCLQQKTNFQLHLYKTYSSANLFN